MKKAERVPEREADSRDEKRQRYAQCHHLISNEASSRSLYPSIASLCRRRSGDDGTLKRQEYNELEDFSNRLNSLIIRVGDRNGPAPPAVESSTSRSSHHIVVTAGCLAR